MELSLKQRNTLYLTQERKQSLQLLQASHEHLLDTIETTLQENPLLSCEPHADTTRPNTPFTADPPRLEDTLAETLDFKQHLHTQLQASRCPEALWPYVSILIDLLDERGYFPYTHAQLLEETELAWTQDCFEDSLTALRTLEPAGVGASSLQDCLLLQLKTRPQTPDCVLAQTLITHHFQSIAQKDEKTLLKQFSGQETCLKKSIALIQSLTPKPAFLFHATPTQTITPDLWIWQEQGRWQVALNPHQTPHVYIEDSYKQSIQALQKQEKPELYRYLYEGQWFIKALQQRGETLLKFGHRLLETQKSFFMEGPTALKPLTRQALAHTLNLHESTVSRIVSKKHIHTPYGLFPLHAFFSQALPKQTDCSALQIKAHLKQLIASESSETPLSDQQLTEQLQKMNFKLSRRTVTKYREQLRIPTARERKTCILFSIP